MLEPSREARKSASTGARFQDEACDVGNFLRILRCEIKWTEESARLFSILGTFCVEAGHTSTMAAAFRL